MDHFAASCTFAAIPGMQLLSTNKAFAVVIQIMLFISKQPALAAFASYPTMIPYLALLFFKQEFSGFYRIH
jgi:hypothetical protein